MPARALSDWCVGPLQGKEPERVAHFEISAPMTVRSGKQSCTLCDFGRHLMHVILGLRQGLESRGLRLHVAVP